MKISDSRGIILYYMYLEFGKPLGKSDAKNICKIDLKVLIFLKSYHFKHEIVIFIRYSQTSSV
jgi:hypothetical protein